MKIAVIGASALGSLLGGLLALRSEDVTLVGREDHVRAMEDEGLRLVGAAGAPHVRVKARTELRESPDLAVFAVKTQDLAEACRLAVPVLRTGPIVTM